MAMKSVADELRERDREAMLKLSVEERMELAFELGDEDLALFCQQQGLTGGPGSGSFSGAGKPDGGLANASAISSDEPTRSGLHHSKASGA